MEICMNKLLDETMNENEEDYAAAFFGLAYPTNFLHCGLSVIFLYELF